MTITMKEIESEQKELNEEGRARASNSILEKGERERLSKEGSGLQRASTKRYKTMIVSTTRQSEGQIESRRQRARQTSRQSMVTQSTEYTRDREKGRERERETRAKKKLQS